MRSRSTKRRSVRSRRWAAGQGRQLVHAAIQIGRASTATMLSSLGMAFGPLAGGWVFDTFDAYGLLFVGSFAVGLGAAEVARAFPPLPRERLQPA
jgi:MFS family permease